MSHAMIDIHCASYPRPPRAVTLDIDDTVDVVHGTRQLSLFNTHHGERCFLPIHVYDTATARPVAVLPRSGKTPSGREVRGHIRRLVRRIRAHWPRTKLTIRGGSHYGRFEAMAFIWLVTVCGRSEPLAVGSRLPGLHNRACAGSITGSSGR